jgi:hypothetical protein
MVAGDSEQAGRDEDHRAFMVGVVRGCHTSIVIAFGPVMADGPGWRREARGTAEPAPDREEGSAPPVGYAVNWMSSSGRGCFGGRPRRRF